MRGFKAQHEQKLQHYEAADAMELVIIVPLARASRRERHVTSDVDKCAHRYSFLIRAHKHSFLKRAHKYSLCLGARASAWRERHVTSDVHKRAHKYSCFKRAHKYSYACMPAAPCMQLGSTTYPCMHACRHPPLASLTWHQ